ncbi:MAG: hypothetical protein LBD04_06940 [Synergistaceae bacterium]|nr:hypothetical protein [Synergistaceae bacterium]
MDENGTRAAYHIVNRRPPRAGQSRLTYTAVPAFGKKTGRRGAARVMPFERTSQHRGVLLYVVLVTAANITDEKILDKLLEVSSVENGAGADSES